MPALGQNPARHAPIGGPRHSISVTGKIESLRMLVQQNH